jgi:hypothetical protein
MKNLIILILLLLVDGSINAQIINDNNSIVWNPYSSDSRVSFTFYSKGIMSGVLESAELIFINNTNNKLSVKVSYEVFDVCGGSKKYTKSDVLESGASSTSSGAFFSGVDYETNCKDEKILINNLKTKISYVLVIIRSIEDLTAQEELIRQEKEELYKKKKKEEKEEKEIRLSKEKERLIAEENRQKVIVEEAKIIQDGDTKNKKDIEDKLTNVKSMNDENERKQAIDKITDEKREIEKKSIENKIVEYKNTKTVAEKQKEQIETEKRVMTAQKFESQGDKLKNSDPSAALVNYQEAQSYEYTQRVEDKIKSLNSVFIAAGAFGVVQGVGQITDLIDPEGNTRHHQLFSGFDGISGNFNKLYSGYKQSPYNITFYGLRMSSIFLAFEFRIGYNNSPIYEFEVVSNEQGEDVILDHVGAQQQTFSLGASAGLNFNIGNFCIYALYGAEWNSIATKTTLYSSGQYKLIGGNLHLPAFMFRFNPGIDFKIPKTSFGIGIRYNMNNINTNPITNYVEISNSNSTNYRYTYYINKITKANYKYNNLGLRVIWDFE